MRNEYLEIELRLLCDVVDAARAIAKGKRDHVHPLKDVKFDPCCQTCRLIVALDALDSWVLEFDEK